MQESFDIRPESRPGQIRRPFQTGGDEFFPEPPVTHFCRAVINRLDTLNGPFA